MMAEAQAPISPMLMGIVNVTPDSFSDGGVYFTSEAAIKRAFALKEEGADIIDIGGESTGPNSKPISAKEEWSRVGKVVKAISKEMAVSIDTYKSEVAERALDCGVKYVNDTSALRADLKMVNVVSKSGCRVILMHSKEEATSPHVTCSDKDYKDIAREVADFLVHRVQFARDNGVKMENIILDPGLGFFISQKSEYSWELLRRVGELLPIGNPLLVGVSRKGFLKTPNEASPIDRDPISSLIGVYLAKRGVSFLRTHNVKMMKTFLEIWNNLN